MSSMRRSHAKSRNGCAQCKNRRVKCDEMTPVCTRCKKRGEVCSFASERGSSSPNTSSHHLHGDHCSRQHLELELMYHFATQTSHTMGSNSARRSPIMDCMPEQGLEHDFLLDVIFSFTALHIAFTKPHEAERYIAVAVRYRDRGIARIAPNVAEPSEDVIVPMFWFSVLVGMVTIAMTVVARERSRNAFIATLVKLAQLWRGAHAIAQRAKAIGSEQDIMEALRASSEWRGPDRASGATVKLEPDIENHLAELERLVKDGSLIYAESAAHTRQAFKSWVAEKAIDEVLSWIAELGNEFASSLSAGNPLALLCTLVHGVLMHQIDDWWWAAGSGKAVVHECSTALADCNPEWRPLIRWCRERVGLSLPLIP